jgi:hypothetical protein
MLGASQPPPIYPHPPTLAHLGPDSSKKHKHRLKIEFACGLFATASTISDGESQEEEEEEEAYTEASSVFVYTEEELTQDYTEEFLRNTLQNTVCGSEGCFFGWWCARSAVCSRAIGCVPKTTGFTSVRGVRVMHTAYVCAYGISYAYTQIRMRGAASIAGFSSVRPHTLGA